MLKKKFKILFFTLLFILTGISGYFLGIKYSSNTNQTNTQVANPDPTKYILNQQIDSLPDYVPPNNAGNNKCWNGNKNKMILNNRKCYFGNGLGKQYRYRYRFGQTQ